MGEGGAGLAPCPTTHHSHLAVNASNELQVRNVRKRALHLQEITPQLSVWHNSSHIKMIRRFDLACFQSVHNSSP